mmetsp:Transcript_30538/g.58811  ORF Transcript_30538/g.58811 Transcript_30538/m.58811 type:complete len:204 (+) Transcript_30538:718-1329(+)
MLTVAEVGGLRLLLRVHVNAGDVVVDAGERKHGRARAAALPLPVPNVAAQLPTGHVVCRVELAQNHRHRFGIRLVDVQRLDGVGDKQGALAAGFQHRGQRGAVLGVRVHHQHQLARLPAPPGTSGSCTVSSSSVWRRLLLNLLLHLCHARLHRLLHPDLQHSRVVRAASHHSHRRPRRPATLHKERVPLDPGPFYAGEGAHGA